MSRMDWQRCSSSRLAKKLYPLAEVGGSINFFFSYALRVCFLRYTEIRWLLPPAILQKTVELVRQRRDQSPRPCRNAPRIHEPQNVVVVCKHSIAPGWVRCAYF